MTTSVSEFKSSPSRPFWSRRHTAYALLAILAVWALAAAAWPLTGTVVPWDSKNHFYPMLRYLGAALAHGELPLWNPYHFSGHPAVADPQSLLFTPTMVLFAWLVPEPSMQLFDVASCSLTSCRALLPSCRCSADGAGIPRAPSWRPIIFMLGGSATARLQHTGIIFSYGFFPLALWLLEEALDRRSYRWGRCLRGRRRVHDGRARSGRLPVRPDPDRRCRLPHLHGPQPLTFLTNGPLFWS